MKQEFDGIWISRSAAFRKEIMGYAGYVIQSGLPGFLIFMLILGSIGYSSFIRDIPPQFPIKLVGVIVLTPFVCRSPLRTWLKNADVVFLLRFEAAMPAYISRALRKSLLPGIAISLIVLLIYWPLYTSNAASRSAGGWLLILMMVALYIGNSIGSWQERRMAWIGAMQMTRVLRWGLSAASIGAFLTVEPWKAILFTVLEAVLLAIVYRIPRKFSFPWERLILEEKRTVSQYYRFLSLFVDVPTLPAKVYRRGYVSWIAARIRLHRGNTYIYLYTLTMMRTELLGILLRLMLLGMLVIYWLADAVWLSGWGAVCVQLLVLLIIGLQMGSLNQSHRFSIWRHVYPLPEDRRKQSLQIVDRRVMLIVALLLWISGAVPLFIHGSLGAAICAAVIMGIYLALIRPARLKRKLDKDHEED